MARYGSSVEVGLGAHYTEVVNAKDKREATRKILRKIKSQVGNEVPIHSVYVERIQPKRVHAHELRSHELERPSRIRLADLGSSIREELSSRD
jgi:hypothetical protein